LNNQRTKIRSAIRRDQAETYILTSLVAFAITVIVTRAFLEITGYPQIGNSVLHIAHALWGGLLLIIAAYLPLAYANRWALQASAVLGGVGIGLFIDEVGKFITQANDYFFPPSLSLIYGFFLLCVFLFLLFRRSHQENPRQAMYHAFEGLKEAIDGDLDSGEAVRIEAQLATAKQSNRKEIATLATALGQYLENEKDHLPAATPGFWRRITNKVDELGGRVGRRRHRAIISIVFIAWAVFVASYISVIVQAGPNIDPQVLQWRTPLIVVQIAVGILLVIATFFWLIKKEELGLKFGVIGFLLSLVALQLLYFYISQFLAITMTLLQVAILLVLFAYRRWYLFSGD
jgi:hypothetical protein